MAEETTSKERLKDILRLMSPGTPLYEALENILRARTGGLIVVGDSEEVMGLTNGGFQINADMHPSALYELAKMDGAIVLSEDTSRILLANTQLTPDPLIPTLETGARHRTAERVARQTGRIVICISQRRNVITIYQGSLKYVVRDIGVVLTKANQALETLEKYKSVLQQALINLSALEFEDRVTLFDVVTVLQRAQMVCRIMEEIELHIYELGIEGRLVAMQQEELMVGIDGQGLLVAKDYSQAKEEAEKIWEELMTWDSEDLLEASTLARALGYSSAMDILDKQVTPRGYRTLSKIPRLPMPVIENLIQHFGYLPKVMEADITELDDVEGIGEVRAKAIKEGLRKMKDQVLIDRQL
ncbi:MAG: DNA integrity scanning diadenylate cyclase DisA [Limnochordia bacterium]|jgi:diadenylate cyclase|nr:DNA integrity scanning diadenylate cyclase DisA [Limnochordia bacterium]MDD2629176.1 DNA integrity scanning diadenylate cyclase DisA [Limnochordia bacterium]MDD4517326.1 DNA integrity scanning diadenylate cyclase DisA [Limnochordia bacterium]